MSDTIRISCPQSALKGDIVLEPSKSISNRLLIIRSLCGEPFTIHRLSKSDDTMSLVSMLSSVGDILNSGHAGSSYRFMVARACLGDKEITLDGSPQLRRRPIGPLVKALQALGADITYLNKEGFPPLLIKPAEKLGKEVHEIKMQAGISSQYISALLMIAPYLPEGLILHLSDEPVSVPYIRMTLDIMKHYGVEHQWTGNTITISSGTYIPKDFTVEGDWSAAAYYYAMAALSPKASIFIEGLSENSLQGDAVVKEIYAQLNVETVFRDNGIEISKKDPATRPADLNYDFSGCPDLAQAVMVTLAGLGVKGKLSGLKTLRIKETDRIKAMQTELAKVKTQIEVLEEADNITCVVKGKAKWKDKAKFDTYEDHRMAMSLTALACMNPVIIRDTQVVSKSYPGFWKDIQSIGLKTEKIRGKEIL